MILSFFMSRWRDSGRANFIPDEGKYFQATDDSRQSGAQRRVARNSLRIFDLSWAAPDRALMAKRSLGVVWDRPGPRVPSRSFRTRRQWARRDPNPRPTDCRSGARHSLPYRFRV